MKLKIAIAFLGAIAATAVTVQVSADGNRYPLPRYYLSEISVSDAYLEMEHSKGHNKAHKHAVKPVLVDVRTLREYASGHPEDAYNVPFPHIYGGGDQDPVTMYEEVYDIVNGNLDAPIMLMCRTGYRSVLAGNILANPESDVRTANKGLQPFTNVRNIWEGFVGQYRYAFTDDGKTILLDADNKPYALDLNNDKVMNFDVADVYTQTKDANPDKDGWRNFAGLPWKSKVKRPLSYLQDPGLYSDLNLTPVPAE